MLVDILGKNKEYLKNKIEELETNSTIQTFGGLCRGINDFKKDYQLRTNKTKDENGDLITNSGNILSRLRNHFSQLLNVFGVNDVRQTEIHTSEPLVPEPSAFEIEMSIEEVKRHKSPETAQIPTELIKTGGRKIRSEIHKHINSTLGMSKNWLRSGRSRPLYIFIRRAIKRSVVIIEALCQVRKTFIQNLIVEC
jgi:hypothetical protein